jgi:methionine-rich copper-binding protein CopC
MATGLVALTATMAVTANLAAQPAWAHSRLLRTDPADASTVTTPITRLTLTFNETVRGDFTTVIVDGPGDAGYGKGPVQVVDHEARQETYPLGSGGYRVAWRAISADGHPVEGQFDFTVALPPGQEPTSRPAPTVAAGPAHRPSSGTGGGWLWGGGAVVVLALAAGALALARRRHYRTEGTR